MTAYLWLKAFHIVFVVTWFAALFYMPRLFVYHRSADDTISLERFKVMEHKLYRIIMTPSMLLTVVLGVVLLWLTWESWAQHAWIWLKIVLVVVLIGYHHYCGAMIKAFARDERPHSEKFFRIFNELPSLLLILIVLLAVLKPF